MKVSALSASSHHSVQLSLPWNARSEVWPKKEPKIEPLQGVTPNYISFALQVVSEELAPVTLSPPPSDSSTLLRIWEKATLWMYTWRRNHSEKRTKLNGMLQRDVFYCDSVVFLHSSLTIISDVFNCDSVVSLRNFLTIISDGILGT